MTHSPWVFRVLLTVAVSAFALALATATAQTAPQTTQPPVTPAEPAGAQGSEYVGEDTCLTCHSDMTRGYHDSLHGQVAHARSPRATQGCESCHGPGARHVEDPTVPHSILRFDQVQAQEASDACLTCHNRDGHALWQGSMHDQRNMSCATCHSAHDFKSARAQLTTETEVQTCAPCHRVQTQKVMRLGHMPVPEGLMECSSCHNPHGSTNERQLRVGNWINESCVSCHTDKRGPFLFEHAAGRENCITCHDPHGSNNDRMLVAKLPMLCQRCHIGTRHPSTIYDMAAVRNKSNRIINRGCVNCHQAIHGSNHPSGHSFLR